MGEWLSIAQLLGFVSLVLGMISFGQKSDRRLKVVLLLFNINHCFHFLLLGANVSAINAAIAACRTYTSMYVSSKWLATVFVLLAFLLGSFAASSWLDYLPTIGMSIVTYSLFALKGIPMRVGLMCGGLCWLINNIVVGSIGGSVLEALLLMMNFLTIHRLADQNPIIQPRAE